MMIIVKSLFRLSHIGMVRIGVKRMPSALRRNKMNGNGNGKNGNGNGKEAEKVELSARKIEQLRRQPIIESVVLKSEDGEWILHKTIITDIKPVSYFEKVVQG
jgi:hypothetical protein